MASIGVLPRLPRLWVLALASLCGAVGARRRHDPDRLGRRHVGQPVAALRRRRSKGYFDAADLKLDVVFSQSNASVIQQLAAGSYNIAPSAGIVDPIRAIEKGAPLSIVRILIQAPPYALLAKPAIKSIKDLKGKTIIIGGAKDVTRIFTERMLEPNGLKSGDYDYIFAGATSARFSALQSGAVDAAILTVPFNFYAESAGFTNLGFTFDYIPDMPFAGDGGQPHLGDGQSEGGRALPRRHLRRASPGSRIPRTATRP